MVYFIEGSATLFHMQCSRHVNQLFKMQKVFLFTLQVIVSSYNAFLCHLMNYCCHDQKKMFTNISFKRW